MADHGSPVGVRRAFDILRGLQEDAGECGYVDEDGAGADQIPCIRQKDDWVMALYKLL